MDRAVLDPNSTFLWPMDKTDVVKKGSKSFKKLNIGLFFIFLKTVLRIDYYPPEPSTTLLTSVVFSEHCRYMIYSGLANVSDPYQQKRIKYFFFSF